MNERLEPLIKNLASLGFGEHAIQLLRLYHCLQLCHFTIRTGITKGGDRLNLHLYFEQNENSFALLYYDAILRKEINLPQQVVSQGEVMQLVRNMEAINWKDLFAEDNILSSQQEETVYAIMGSLKTLDADPGTKELASATRVRYWADTALQEIFSLSALKTRFEIAQRFYFFEDQPSIGVEEAYLFLNNRWMEKQLHAKSKPVDSPFLVQTKPRKRKIKKKRDAAG